VKGFEEPIFELIGLGYLLLASLQDLFRLFETLGVLFVGELSDRMAKLYFLLVCTGLLQGSGELVEEHTELLKLPPCLGFERVGLLLELPVAILVVTPYPLVDDLIYLVFQVFRFAEIAVEKILFLLYIDEFFYGRCVNLSKFF
jgi:hypothetical protein